MSELLLVSQGICFPSGFPFKLNMFYSLDPTRTTCPAHLIPRAIQFLIIFGEEEHKS